MAVRKWGCTRLTDNTKRHYLNTKRERGGGGVCERNYTKFHNTFLNNVGTRVLAERSHVSTEAEANIFNPPQTAVAVARSIWKLTPTGPQPQHSTADAVSQYGD